MVEETKRKLDSIESAVADLKAGRPVILVDDEDRENEGDLVYCAEHITADKINFMAKEGRGLICLALTPERCDQLDLPLMVSDNTSSFGTGFTVSIEAKEGVTTGISAHDRAVTVLAAIDKTKGAEDLARPGHIFPLRAREGGVLIRVGQTEGSVDLCRIAGLDPSAVICEIMNEDGTMARLPELKIFAKKHDLKIITVKDIVEHRLSNEMLVKRAAEVKMPTRHGLFETTAYENSITGELHLALHMGDTTSDEPILTRVHSQCLTGDVFGSERCDCGEQLDTAMKMVAEKGRGIILYLFQEGRGIGLLNKLKAYALQDEGHDTVSANKSLGFKADLRDYGIGAQMLRDLGAHKLRLLTNNPRKVIGLDAYGLSIVERIPLLCTPKESNLRYLKTKESKLGHMLGLKKLGE